MQERHFTSSKQPIASGIADKKCLEKVVKHGVSCGQGIGAAEGSFAVHQAYGIEGGSNQEPGMLRVVMAS